MQLLVLLARKEPRHLLNGMRYIVFLTPPFAGSVFAKLANALGIGSDATRDLTFNRELRVRAKSFPACCHMALVGTDHSIYTLLNPGMLMWQQKLHGDTYNCAFNQLLGIMHGNHDI